MRFAEMIGVEEGDVEDVRVEEFAGMGYGGVVRDVEGALGSGTGSGSGEVVVVVVFRVRRDHARVQWWVLGVVDGEVVGLMAEGVES